MRLKLISCQVFCREAEAVIARSSNKVEVEFLSKGLHEIGCIEMRQRLQAAVDGAENGGYEALLLGYGLCNHGIAGLCARSIPMVVPRAHDCITILLGSKERYLDYFQQHPGTYFKSSGWIEHSQNPDELKQLSIATRGGLNATLDELIAKYGEENGRYLYQELVEHTRHYRQFTFIEMGVEPDNRFERQTQDEAQQRGWKYEKVRGDLTLFQRLVDGIWEPWEFLVVPPGQQIAAAFDENIVTTQETTS